MNDGLAWHNVTQEYRCSDFLFVLQDSVKAGYLSPYCSVIGLHFTEAGECYKVDHMYGFRNL